VYNRTLDTGWRRRIECLELQVIFRKRATNCRALLRKMTYKDKASHGSSPPCTIVCALICVHGCARETGRERVFVFACMRVFACVYNVTLNTSVCALICVHGCVRERSCEHVFVFACMCVFACVYKVTLNSRVCALICVYGCVCGRSCERVFVFACTWVLACVCENVCTKLRSIRSVVQEILRFMYTFV